MGLFSSSSKSSNTSNTNDFSLTGVDNRISEGENAVIGGNINLGAGGDLSNVDITSTDFGSVKESFEFARAALDSNEDATKQAIDKSFALAGQASTSETAGALQDFMKWSTVVILGGGALYFVVKKFS